MNAEKQIEYNAVKKSADNLRSKFGGITFFFFLSYFVAIIGLSFWYFKVQRPIDHDNKQRINQPQFKGESYFSECQSCKKSFLFHFERGKEKDGDQSPYFCSNCYDRGQYINPELTYAEAWKQYTQYAKSKGASQRDIKKVEKKFKKLLRWKR